jgi:hypothetical protein
VTTRPETEPRELLDEISAYLDGDPFASLREVAEKSQAGQEDHYTGLGTLCSLAWNNEWIAKVNAAEAQLGRRICGARTVAGTPCAFESNHSSGRCRFHGGFELTGAPIGNRNAVLHGLYSRRLQICGAHCPLWESCPCSGEDVLAAPPKERPTCPYEQTEYNAFVSDAARKSDYTQSPDPLDRHMIHLLGLLHVMTNRAAAALRMQPLIETVTATSADYRMESVKVNTVLQAFLRIAREYRCFRAQFDQNHILRAKYPDVSDPTAQDVIAHATRTFVDTDLDPEAQQLSQNMDMDTMDYADRFMRKAFKAAKHGDDAGVLDAMHQSIILDPIATLKGEDLVLGAYRPREGQTLPEEALRLIIKRMKVDPDELYPQGQDAFSKMRAAEWERRVHSINHYRKRRSRSP